MTGRRALLLKRKPSPTVAEQNPGPIAGGRMALSGDVPLTGGHITRTGNPI